MPAMKYEIYCPHTFLQVSSPFFDNLSEELLLGSFILFNKDKKNTYFYLKILVYSFVHQLINSFIHPFVHLIAVHLFTTLNESFIQSLTHHLFTNFTYPSIHYFTRSIIPLFIHFFTYHLFTRLLTNSSPQSLTSAPLITFYFFNK